MWSIRRELLGLDLVEILDRLLDKGITVEPSDRIRVSADGLRQIGARIVVESVETYNGHRAQLRPVLRPTLIADNSKQSGATLLIAPRDGTSRSRP
jgi:hypothetical protein